MKTYTLFVAAAVLSWLTVCPSHADELADLYNQVEILNIGRNGYTLGKVLTDRQKQTAQDHAEEKTSPGTHKFKDDHLYIVTDKATDRVLILYERHQPTSREKIREVVGALFYDFGDPTIMAHDKIIYWAYDKRGKISEEQYREAKATKKPLETLVTVKLDSSHSIIDSSDPEKDSSIYYIVSSEPLLKLLNNQDQ